MSISPPVQPVTSTSHDTATIITIDDGKANALSIERITQINAALDEAELAGKPVVLLGRSGIFSAGFHLGEMSSTPQNLHTLLTAGANLCVRLLQFPLPTITGCTGHAYPMGAFILMSSDYRIGSEGDFRIGLNEVAIGMTIPQFALDLATHRLLPHYCARTALTSEMYDPATAQIAGFLDEVTQADQVLTRALQKSAELSAINLEAHKGTKVRLRSQIIKTMTQSIETGLTLASAKASLAA